MAHLREAVRDVLRRSRKNPVLGPAIRAPFRAYRALGGRLPVRIFQHLWFVGEIDVDLPNGSRFRMYSHGDVIENAYYWRGIFGHEAECVRPWLELAQRARTVLDIGANTGAYSLMACAADQTVRVHAFEPVVRIAERTRANVAMNPGFNIEVHAKAVGGETGVALLSDPGGDNCYSASLDPAFLPMSEGRYEVPVTTIDDFAAQRGLQSVDLVKIDVEGFEEFVIDGMRSVISRHRPALLVEFLSDARLGLRERLERLCGLGYALFHLTTAGPRRSAEVSASKFSKNVVLVPAERAPPGWG